MKQILVFPYTFEYNLLIKISFKLFADTSSKAVFLARVDQDLTYFTLWPNFAANIGCELEFSVFSQISTQSIQKSRLWLL